MQVWNPPEMNQAHSQLPTYSMVPLEKTPSCWKLYNLLDIIEHRSVVESESFDKLVSIFLNVLGSTLSYSMYSVLGT